MEKTKNTKTLRPISLAAVLLGVAVLLHACGGSGAGAGTAAPAAPAVSAVGGTVTGFGSVMIDNAEYAVGGATQLEEEIDPSSPSPLLMSGLELGVHVDFDMSSGMLGLGIVRPRVVGPVAAGSETAASGGATTGSFVALGQTVYTTSATLFAGGLTSFAGITDGAIVKVHGTRNADGSITATRVESLPTNFVLPGYMVSGTLSALGGTAPATTFSVNALAVTDASTTQLLPPSATLADGESVTVFAPVSAWAGTASATPAVVAGVVRVRPSLVGQAVIEGGLVDSVTPAGGPPVSFTMDGFTVDASQSPTVVVNGMPGTLASVVVGAHVVVEGTVSASGTLVATRIWVCTPQAMLLGPIYSVPAGGNSASGGSFVLRHTTVTYDGTTMFLPAAKSWADLAPGVFVIVRGTAGSGGIAAQSITFATLPCGVTWQSLQGDAPSGWSPPDSMGTMCAHPNGSHAPEQAAGTVSAVSMTGMGASAATGFTLTRGDGSSVSVATSATTVFLPPGSSLADGAQVFVLGTFDSAGVLDASLVAVQM